MIIAKSLTPLALNLGAEEIAAIRLQIIISGTSSSLSLFSSSLSLGVFAARTSRKPTSLGNYSRKLSRKMHTHLGF